MAPRKQNNVDANAFQKLWGVPNWKKAPEYNYINTLDDERLSWEFTRRRRVYRDEWIERQKVGKSFRGMITLDPKTRGDELPTPFYFVQTLDFHPPTAIASNSKKTKNSPKDTPSLDQELHKFYGDRLTEVFLGMIDEGYLLIPFHPMHPPDPQLKDALKIMMESRAQRVAAGEKIVQRSKKPHDPITLLRVLDGTDVGATDTEIADELFRNAGTNAVWRARKRAEEQLISQIW